MTTKKTTTLRAADAEKSAENTAAEKPTADHVATTESKTEPEVAGSSDKKTKADQVAEPSEQNAEAAQEPEYLMLIEKGMASKLSPKSEGKIYFQLGRNPEDNSNYLRIESNEGGGLHTREWIPLDKIISTLESQSDTPFKSTLLKSCIKGKSSNNASFLAAILRSAEIGLIKPAEKSAFQHELAEDFAQRSTVLLKRTK